MVRKSQSCGEVTDGRLLALPDGRRGEGGRRVERAREEQLFAFVHALILFRAFVAASMVVVHVKAPSLESNDEFFCLQEDINARKLSYVKKCAKHGSIDVQNPM